MGRAPHQPLLAQRRQVEAMAAYGFPEDDIAKVVGMDPKTLRKHYRDELDTGHVKANARVAEVLFQKATGDGPQSVTAVIFWLKTRAKWREARPGEGEDSGRPLVNILRWMSDEEAKADAAANPHRLEYETDETD